MMTRTMLLSLLLAGAGCAHRTYVGATYSGTDYSSGDSGYYYEPATSRGAGARALTGRDYQSAYPENSDTVSYGALSTSDSFAATTQGAGARALTGRPDTTQYGYIEPGVTVYNSGVGGAETAGGTTVVSSSNLANDDANFVREAMQLGAAEVRIGELAQQKAMNSSLRDFGKMIVTDRQKSNDELQQLAQQKQASISTSTAMTSREQGMVDKLSSAQGRDFDRMCERDLVSTHEKAVRAFKREAEHGQDADLRAFAQKTLPTLEQHLQQAKDLKKEKLNT